MSKSPKKVWTPPARLYTLEVFLESGPLTEEFEEQNEVVSRTIPMRGDAPRKGPNTAGGESNERRSTRSN